MQASNVDMEELVSNTTLDITEITQAIKDRIDAQKTREFTLFAALPLELRLRIWSLVDHPYDDERVHPIRGVPETLLKSDPCSAREFDKKDLLQMWDSRSGRRAQPKWLHERVVFRSPHSIHPIIHTCQESRNYVIQKFSLVFEFETWINYKKDALFLDKSIGLSGPAWDDKGHLSGIAFSRSKHGSKMVKSLALHFHEPEEEDWSKRIMSLDIDLSVIEEVYLVKNDFRDLGPCDGNVIAAGSQLWSWDYPFTEAEKRRWEDKWVKHANCADWKPPAFITTMWGSSTMGILMSGLMMVIFLESSIELGRCWSGKWFPCVNVHRL
jgi:hypothetical protein